MIRSSNVWLPEPRSYTAGSLGTLHTGKPAFFTCLHAIALVAFTMFTNSYELFTSVKPDGETRQQEPAYGSPASRLQGCKQAATPRLLHAPFAPPFTGVPASFCMHPSPCY